MHEQAWGSRDSFVEPRGCSTCNVAVPVASSEESGTVSLKNNMRRELKLARPRPSICNTNKVPDPKIFEAPFASRNLEDNIVSKSPAAGRSEGTASVICGPRACQKGAGGPGLI